MREKMNNEARKLRGRIKRNAGEVTGNVEMQREGQADEVRGNAGQVGERIKDAFRGTRRRRRGL